MICSLWLIVPAGIFLFESIQTGRQSIPERVQRFSKGLNRLLLIVPLLAVAVFAVLFLFVLKGRIYERACHAMLVLALWLYAARYWWFVIAYYKYMSGRALYRIIPIIVVLAAIAIDLTPLDRYAESVHSCLGAASILPGIILLLFFYVAAFFTTCANRNKLHSDLWWDMWWL